ncbi:MAG: class I SAM-dependent methyltransferase [SAR202 cluster bacterium]|nr:class I SAM-dependent methyltransferase [SAR202 cluster bacterium]
MTSIYDAWADVYDSVYSYVRDDIPFYVEEALAAGGPVLELGCGTGRVTIPIAEAGIDITGVELSTAMLDVARRKAAAMSEDSKPRLVVGDMRELGFGGQQFHLIIIPFRGFLALMTVEDQMSALSSISSHLVPDGKLIFDVFVPDLDMLVQAGDTSYHLRDVIDAETGRRLVLWHQSAYDNHAQIIDARIIVEELNEAGTVVGRYYRDFELRYAHRWELQHLLTTCGYAVDDLYGDFERTLFDEDSKDMVWVASHS